jgi:hypothetical protein
MCADTSTIDPPGGLYPGAACRLDYFLASCIFPAWPAVLSQRKYRTRDFERRSGDDHFQGGLASSGFDPLRAIVGQYSTGAGVATAISPDGSLAGMTINSLTPVSLGPPLVLWCLQRSSARFSVFAGAGYFGVSILAAHRERLARRFAARHPAPFRGLA